MRNIKTYAVNKLNKSRFRTILSFYLILYGLISLLYCLIYFYLFNKFEPDRTTGLLKSLQVVIESLTTAGFGGHSPWSSNILQAWVIWMNLTGVLITFVLLPIVITLGIYPVLREVLDVYVPDETDLDSHVIICSHSEIDENIVEELNCYEKPYLFIINDKDKAADLYRKGYNVIYGDPSSEETLRKANISKAEFIVADEENSANSAVILSAIELNEDIKTIGTAENDKEKELQQRAGVDINIMPKSWMGESLSYCATFDIERRIKKKINVKDTLEVGKILVKEDDKLDGVKIENISSVEFENNIICIWKKGQFIINPNPEVRIIPNTILFYIKTDKLDEDEYRQMNYKNKQNKVYIFGLGETGKTADKMIRYRGKNTVTVDRDINQNPDTEKDITSIKEVEEIPEIKRPNSYIISLDNDQNAIRSTLIISQINEKSNIIVRANNKQNVEKLYNAGADWVLTLPFVIGQKIASKTIEKEYISDPKIDFNFKRIECPEKLQGKKVKNTNVKDEKNWIIICIERENKLIKDIKRNTKLKENDTLIIEESKN